MKKSKVREELIMKRPQEAASCQKTQAQVSRDNGVNLNTFHI